jgi:hypothetical protein
MHDGKKPRPHIGPGLPEVLLRERPDEGILNKIIAT